MKSSWMLAAAGLALFSSLACAQRPPGVTPEQVATALPEEGAPKAIFGTYAVMNQLAFGNDNLKVFRPTDLANFPQKDKLPVLVWGNGGCAINVGRYAGFLETIASHGFLVIGTNAGTQPPAAANPSAAAPQGAPGAPGAGAGGPRARSATAADLLAGINWAEAENAREGSPLKGKIDTQHVAVMGQSCGGMLSMELGADPRVKTIGVFNAGLQPDKMDELKKLHGPVLFINGHERDFMWKPSKATFDALEKLPAFYGARHGAGHTATAYHPGGGEFANVATNWVLWQFKHDNKAAKMFVGRHCGLCTNSNWDAESKRLK
jgi:dienelactone hydrolase